MFQPVIIIGAGRSGTNMLRDILTELPGFGTWPCDEINYIWRHGNVRYPNDEFTVDLATPVVRKYIQGAFLRLAKKRKLSYVVEKTCANSLRVGFVNRVIPNAKYIFIVRDGRDVVASALKRWEAPLDIPYVAKKARFVPITDMPYYGVRFLWNRIYRLLSPEKRLAFWGPRFKGMEEMLRTRSLPEVCAMQWIRCVDKAERELKQFVPSDRIIKLHYEDFVKKPHNEIKRLAAFLNIDVNEELIHQLSQGVSSKSVGKWKKDSDQKVLENIIPLLRKILKRHGYL